MWEHLYYDTEEQIETALRGKGLPEVHSKSIADFIINSTFISRKKASDIIREDFFCGRFRNKHPHKSNGRPSSA